MDLIPHEDYKEQVLSCGHRAKYIERAIQESISISDKVTASKTIKIESLTNTPILVSGDSGIKEYGIHFTLNITNFNGNLILDKNSVNNLFSTYQTSVDNSTNIDLHDIFVDIDNSNNTPEDVS